MTTLPRIPVVAAPNNAVACALPHHHADHPRLLLPRGLSPDQVAGLHQVARLLAEMNAARAAPLRATPDADRLAALVAETVAPIVPGGTAHQFRGTPAQTFHRLLAIAADAIEQSGALAADAMLSALPMHGFAPAAGAPLQATGCAPLNGSTAASPTEVVLPCDCEPSNCEPAS